MATNSTLTPGGQMTHLELSDPLLDFRSGGGGHRNTAHGAFNTLSGSNLIFTSNGTLSPYYPQQQIQL